MDILYHNNRLLVPVETTLYSGWAPSTEHKIISGDPLFTWKAARIPYALWSQVVCFLRWSQEKYKQEAMVTFFYDTTNDCWAAWPFPQEPCGMTVKLLPNHPLYEQDRSQFKNGWIQAGSAHHHCTSKAFQSGTDKSDEEAKDGVHITLGEMDKPILDAHVRQVFDGVMGKTDLSDWIEEPPFLKAAPDYFIDQLADFCLRAIKDVEFPEVWKSRIIERVHQPFLQGTCHSACISPQSMITKADSKSKSTRGRGTARCKKQGPDWCRVSRDRVIDAALSLNLTAKEAHDLLGQRFCDAAEDLITRRELVLAIQKTGISPLFAETLLEESLAIDGNAVGG